MKSATRPRDREGDAEPAICGEVRRTHYARPLERTVDDIRRRVARALAAGEPRGQRERWRTQFLQAMRRGFIPGGRINAGAGSSRNTTLINCFVQPIAAQRQGRDDSGRPGVDLALREIARTLRAGGGVGVNLSDLPAATRDSDAAGLDPVSVILRMESRGRSLAAVGARRAAQMALIDIAHPDAEAVIDLKRHHDLHTVTLSICIPDTFMRALHGGAQRERQAPFPHAEQLWHRLIKAAFDTGNPGIVFIDHVNRTNNLSQIECLRACNPCAEQFLPDYGACDLGSIDLTRIVRNPYTPLAQIDFGALDAIAQVAVRALDNVIDLTHWPLAQQAREARLTRRIGLGVTGLADALIMLGLRYDRQPGRQTAMAIMRTIRHAAYSASVDLAIERGPFPLCDADRLIQPPHAASRLPASLKRRIAAHGLRNSHLLAIAPAGTISIAMAGNVSSGVEPVFAPRSVRTIRLPEGKRVQRIVDDLALRLFRTLTPKPHTLPPAWCDVSTLRADDHLRMVAALQPLVDSGISKTLHLQPSASVQDLDRLLRTAWRSGLKGLTVFRPTVGAQTVLCDARLASSQIRT